MSLKTLAKFQLDGDLLEITARKQGLLFGLNIQKITVDDMVKSHKIYLAGKIEQKLLSLLSPELKNCLKQSDFSEALIKAVEIKQDKILFHESEVRVSVEELGKCKLDGFCEFANAINKCWGSEFSSPGKKLGLATFIELSDKENFKTFSLNLISETE
jgi:hypothetical protein